VRFCYKEKEKVNAKILKDVKFQMTLDVFDLCTSELQTKLVPMREKFRIVDERKAMQLRSAKMQKMDTDEAKPVEAKKNGKESAVENFESFSFDDDLGSNNSGLFELVAVLTHKGRASNSGHYVAWTKSGKNGNWLMYDDDEVHLVTEEDILKLSGGGDWHTVYLLLYAPRKLEKTCYEEAVKEQASK
jgi:ubiquitin carboxyl-terminal hydrolase 14